MGKLVFVRHGQTQMNYDHLFFGKLDPPLNELGIEQVNRARNVLQDRFNFIYDNIYSSDLKRASESAEIVNYLDKKIIYDKRLQELDFGIFEGLTYNEIKEKYPEEEKRSHYEWEDYNYETGESPKVMQKRVTEFLDTLDKNKNNLVVAHWGVICSAMSYLFSTGLKSYWKFAVDNGGIVIIEFNDFFPILKGFNV